MNTVMHYLRYPETHAQHTLSTSTGGAHPLSAARVRSRTHIRWRTAPEHCHTCAIPPTHAGRFAALGLARGAHPPVAPLPPHDSMCRARGGCFLSPYPLTMAQSCP